MKNNYEKRGREAFVNAGLGLALILIYFIVKYLIDLLI